MNPIVGITVHGESTKRIRWTAEINKYFDIVQFAGGFAEFNKN